MRTKSKRPKVTKNGHGSFLVAVHEPPTDGKANAAVVSAIAEHFGVAVSRVSIRTGKRSRSKVLEII